MRILKALASFLVIVLILGAIGLLVTREVLLIKALEQLRGDFATIQKKAAAGTYVDDCLRLSGVTSPGVTQLRFFDGSTYGIEVICAGLDSNPILAQKGELPPLVRKLYGDSGFITGSQISGELELVVLGRHGVLYQTELNEVSWRYGVLSPDHALSGPAASCAGYGLTCCSDSLEQGAGRSIQGAVDCPQSCFAQCWERPVVLALNTQPYYDVATRTVTIQAGQILDFDFVISESQKDSFADTSLSDQASFGSVLLALTEQFLNQTPITETKLKEVKIDFGDGEAEVVTDSEGLVSHRYQCAQPVCKYTAVVSAVNVQGAETRTTPINTVIVEVTR
jgi:hypothetical protein